MLGVTLGYAAREPTPGFEREVMLVAEMNRFRSPAEQPRVEGARSRDIAGDSPVLMGVTGNPSISTAQERRLLEQASTGDEDAFRRLVEPYHAELHAHCYRMLGSVHDAEDALQDVLLRAWRGLRRFEGRSSLRSWLYRIATNACLDMAARRPKRVLPLDYGPPGDPHDGPAAPLSESVWLEPYADEQLGHEARLAAPEARYEQREAVELAFVAALQHLPPKQRAALILREVLGFSAQEAAEALATTVPSVKSALQRARKAVNERLPKQTQQATLRSLGDERIRELVDAYMDAWERDDVDAVVAMLTKDATIAMPPTPTWYRGREAIATFYAEWALSGELSWRHVPARANGQPAVACYAWDASKETYVARVLDVLTLRGARIAEITAFADPDAFRRFGLPGELPS
jgi:RNA polymerase sigma-70 factor (ECF subfamily)